MAENDGRKYDALLKTLLGEQERLRKSFEEGANSNDIKADIDLSPETSEVTDFRRNRIDFMVQHIPSTLINSWPAFTGPRSLKRGVEEWVEGLNNDADLQKLLKTQGEMPAKLLELQKLLEERGIN